MEQVPQGTEPKLSEYVWRHLNIIINRLNNNNTDITAIKKDIAAIKAFIHMP